MATQQQINKHIRQAYATGDKLIDKRNAEIERQILKEYRAFLKELRSKLSEAYARYGSKGDGAVALTIEEMQKYGRFDKLEKAIGGDLMSLGRGIGKGVRASKSQSFQTSYYNAGYGLETGLGIGNTINVLNTEAIQAAITNPLDQIKWMESVTDTANRYRRAIRSSLVETFTQGKSFAEAARDLKDKTEKSLNQSARIIRTESTKAKSIGNNAAYDNVVKSADRLGVKLEKVWDAMLDGRVRGPAHSGLDGEPSDEDGYWTYVGTSTKTKGPGLSGVAKQDINCRCTTYAKVDELDGDVEIEPQIEMGFSEWRKNI